MSSRWQVTQVGKYQILEPLGEGAMGVVYRALDPVLGRTVAIKVMTDALAHDDELRSRFLREAQAAGSLQHPNVITIYDFGEVDGHPFIAMELVEGTDLERILSEKAALTLSDKLGIVIDVLNGLAYAHKRGIVHRDIKPANIRIDEEGRARIMDFGIAHLASSNITRTGVMMGTPNYMAPEQVTGGAIAPATDIFAVGAVLYELVTNARPFQADTLHGVLYKVVSEMPPDVETILPGLPHALGDVVRRALAKEPGDRYANATEMAAALSAIRASLSNPPHGSSSMSLRASIETAIATRRTVPTEWRRRRQRRTAIGIGAGALLLVVGTALVVRRLAPPAPAAANAQGVAAADSARPQAFPTTVAAVPQPSAAQPSSARPADPPTDSSRTAESEKQALQYRSLEYSARFARRQAVQAGAAAPALTGGDSVQRSAQRAAESGEYGRAIELLDNAIASWTAVTRQARAAAPLGPTGGARQTGAPATAQASVAAPPPAAGSSAAPASAPQPIASNPTPTVTASAPPTPATPAPDNAAEIGRVVAAYARAMESRDVAELRRAYPGMTPDQQSGFEQFFRSTRSIRATLAVGSVDINAPNADAHVTGTYEYVTSSGETQRQPVSFRAVLRRDAGVWRLMSVR